MFTVTEINHAAQLAEYRLPWRSLWERTPRASFFQTREWLECFLFHYGDDFDLRTLIVSTKNRPVGIVPLIVKRVSSRLGTVRALTYPLNGWGAFYGPIGGNPAAALSGALRHIASSPRNWDTLDLRGVEPSATDAARTENALSIAGFIPLERPWAETAAVDLARISAGDQFVLRRRLQAAERELWRRGNWELVRHRPDGCGTASSLLRTDLWSLAKRLFADRDAIEAEFLRDCYEAAAWQGALDFSLIVQRGEPVGCIIAFVGHDQLEPFAAAFAPEHAEHVRTVLVERLMFDGVQQRNERIVFGPRQLELASGWHARLVSSSRWTHFATFGARAQILRMAQQRHRRASA